MPTAFWLFHYMQIGHLKSMTIFINTKIKPTGKHMTPTRHFLAVLQVHNFLFIGITFDIIVMNLVHFSTTLIAGVTCIAGVACIIILIRLNE